MPIPGPVYASIAVPSMVTNVLFGGYAILFAICMYIIRCKRGTVKRAHQVAIVSLFAFATLAIIFGGIEDAMLIGFFSDIVDPALIVSEDLYSRFSLWPISQTIAFGIYTLANALADFILIYRCYKIWGFKKRVIAFPVLISVVNNGLALVRTIILAINTRPFILEHLIAISPGLDVLELTLRNSFLAVNLLTNLLIPFMIAGRIWWIGRQASKFIGTQKHSLTRRSVAICLESGMMYPLVLIPTLGIYFSSFRFFEGDMIPMLTQIVGIAPTFIIVRVALGISIENVKDTVARDKEINGGQKTCRLMTIFEDNTSPMGASESV
ncbi:hypothetical protein D9758_006527 [Tetrapyrgos nigripes]|uniref:Uncharacterized protein n=1 Tax=Tetrapyrgos nigripes TaxID=182062 RepID=A0A8H5LR11_9AGAR|nr:hypothetical protein D9758_006527 [Tetrapyrgos nigripes]